MKIIHFFLTSFVAICVLIIFLIKPGINDDPHSKFENMINGTAYKPFVYRTLLPTSTKILSQTVPVEVKESLSKEISESPLLSKIFKKLRWENELATEYLIAVLLMFLSLLGFAYAIKYLFVIFYYASNHITNFISIFALLCLPPFFMYTSFLYDFPNLFLFTLGLILLVKQQWKIYFPFLFIAIINKETTILLLIIFFFYYKDKLSINWFRKLLFFQTVAYLITKLMLSFIFRNNAGSFVEVHLIDHNLRLINEYNLVTVATYIVILILILYKWKEKPEFLKISFAMIIPLLFLALFLGYIDELRGYYEIYSAFIILVYHSIAKILDIKINLLYKK